MYNSFLGILDTKNGYRF